MEQVFIWFYILGAAFFAVSLVYVLALLIFGLKFFYSLTKAGRNIKEATEEIKAKIQKTPSFLVGVVTVLGFLHKLLKEKEGNDSDHDHDRLTK